MHVHSTASDGTAEPREIAEAGAGFWALALTDHDTCAGVGEFMGRSGELGVKGLRLAGIELSLESGEGFGEFHLLGLGVDTGCGELKELLEEAREGRNLRNVRMVEKLNALGIGVTLEDAQRHAGDEVMGRPHVARAMVEKGYAADVKDAFERYLKRGRPGYAERWHPEAERAIGAVHAAGGAAVMAHPQHWTQDWVKLEEGLRELKGMGLDGIEAVYWGNPAETTVAHLAIAKRLDLAVTAGSDYHGANKPGVPFGMGVDDEEKFLAPLLARIRGR